MSQLLPDALPSVGGSTRPAGPAGGAEAAPTAETAARLLRFPPRHGGGAPPVPVTSDAVLPPVLTSDVELVRASPLAVAWRLFRLLAALLAYQAAALFDRLLFDRLLFDLRGLLRRRPSRGRRLELATRNAVRLRRALQRLGGSFIKIGQQLAIRSDVLPPLYCRELENLLDRVPPMPEAYVHEVVARETGRPLEESFSAFDFPPIGSASIACVYKARLHSGELVAVKVRRPGIVKVFKTDLAALDLVARTLELLTILRPGVSQTFRSEMRQMLLEELDFRIEARYQELFRVYFRKRKKLRTTAPRIYPRLCGRELIVSDFVSGIWLKEMIAGVESRDPSYRAALRALDISPKKVAKQLIRCSHYSFFECPFFHGDPHPGNVLVQPGNRIVLVDFGACGVFARRERHQLAQMHELQQSEDVGGMVQCVIGLMEPLPPIDVDTFRRRLEDAWWKGFYGIKSKHAQWWERTSFRLWTALLQEVRLARIPLPLNVLRMIRATLLYDSVAARLYRRIDVFDEYRWYYERYARRVRSRIQRAVLHQLCSGLDASNYVRLGRAWEVGNLMLHQAQLLLRKPLPDLSAQVNKLWDLVKISIKWLLGESTVTTVAFIAGIVITRARLGDRIDGAWELPGAFLRVLGRDLADTTRLQPPELVLISWSVLTFLIAVKYLRTAWFRLADKDVYHGRGARSA